MINKNDERFPFIMSAAILVSMTVLVVALSAFTGAAAGEIGDAATPLAAEARISGGAVTTELTVTRNIPYETIYLYDYSMFSGDERILINGATGVLLITSIITTINDVQQSRVEKPAVIAKESTAEVVLVGTSEKPATASTGSYIWPTSGSLTSGFGKRSSSGVGSTNHQGIDICGPAGREIIAADGGLVIRANSEYSGFGNLVQIQHDNGDITYYAHNSKMLVSEGERVKQGQVIALMGRTGSATADHCHFELHTGEDSKPVNPLTYLPAELDSFEIVSKIAA